MVVLGPVAFSGFEVPERIALGGTQRLQVHVLPGGKRVIDALGPDDADLRWSGIMTGPGAAARVRRLEALRRGGEAWPLAWDGWRYTVIVKRFQAEVRGAFFMPYRIQCAVVCEGEPVVFEGAPAGVDQAAALMAAAVDLGAGPGLDAAVTVASAGLADGGLASVAAAAGSLARLITARALAGAAQWNIP